MSRGFHLELLSSTIGLRLAFLCTSCGPLLYTLKILEYKLNVLTKERLDTLEQLGAPNTISKYSLLLEAPVERLGNTMSCNEILLSEVFEFMWVRHP